jgi:hypothetical protein
MPGERAELGGSRGHLVGCLVTALANCARRRPKRLSVDAEPEIALSLIDPDKLCRTLVDRGFGLTHETQRSLVARKSFWMGLFGRE